MRRSFPARTCGKQDFTAIRKFNMMFKTHQGVTEDASTRSTCARRPRRASLSTSRTSSAPPAKSCPSASARSARAFRNEITPGNFTFRTREFEQMELEFFCKPGTDLEWFNYWLDYCHNGLLGLGMKDEHLRLRDHDAGGAEPLPKATTDFEFPVPLRLGRAVGRGRPHRFRPEGAPDDLRREHGIPQPHHQREVHPLCHRAVLGADRVALAFLCEAYDEEAHGGRRHPRGHAPPSGARALQVRRAAAAKNKLRREGRRNLRR